MSNQSPLEIVQEQHGSKPELAKKVFERLEQPEDEEEAHDLEYRIQTLSNRKLLQLWNAHEAMEDEFGSKGELVDAIVSAKFPEGNEEYADKIETFTVPRLMDLARQQSLVSQSKLGWRT